MATLTTNNIVSVGSLDPLVTHGSGEAIQSVDSLLVWDDSAHNHKRLEWAEVTHALSEYETDAVEAKNDAVIAKGAAETAQGLAETAAGTATTKAGEAGIDRGKAEAAALISEGYAVGTQNGTPAESGEPYFQDNAKYYKEQAGISASSASSSATSAGSSATAAASSASAAAASETNAATSETNAGTSETNAASSASDSEASALVSEGWAKGTQNGAAVQSGDYFHNNAKWFKDQAAQSATDAASSASDASDSETAAAASETNAGESETNALAYKNAAEAAANQARSYAAIILMASGTVNQQKTVNLPASGLLEGQIIRVMFPVGHNAASSATYMTLNGIAVLSNQNGVLAPIPIHAMTESGSAVYKVLDANTVLELYYTADYDGNQTPAFVIVGNPLVLSSTTYSIYANGFKTDATTDAVTDGDLRAVTSNAVYDALQQPNPLMDITYDFVLSTTNFSLSYVRYDKKANVLYVRFYQNAPTPISAYNNVVISNRGGHVSIPQYAFAIANLNTLDAKLDVWVSANVLTSDNISIYTYNYSQTSPQAGGTQYSLMIQLT